VYDILASTPLASKAGRNGEGFRERLIEELATSVGAVQLAQLSEAFVTVGTMIYDVVKPPILYPMVKPFLRPSIWMLNAW
jgi:hypothetical protein